MKRIDAIVYSRHGVIVGANLSRSVRRTVEERLLNAVTLV